MAVRVLLLVEDEKNQQRYLTELLQTEVECRPVSCVRDLHRALTEEPFQGIFLDVAASARASVPERGLIHDILDEFPVLRLRWDEKEAQSRGLVYGTNERVTIGEFIERFCGPFAARTIRKKTRIELNLNAQISPTGEFSEDSLEKTVTLNVSHEGCFLLSQNNTWQNFDQAWIRIKELQDPSPIQIEVRWALPWGQSMRLPGIGVKFIRISPDQQKQLLKLLGAKDPIDYA